MLKVNSQLNKDVRYSDATDIYRDFKNKLSGFTIGDWHTNRND